MKGEQEIAESAEDGVEQKGAKDAEEKGKGKREKDEG